MRDLVKLTCEKRGNLITSSKIKIETSVLY